MSQDTLKIDHQLLEQLQHDPRCAYVIDEQRPSVVDELLQKLGQYVGKGLSHISISDGVIYGICVVAMLILLWWLVRSKLLSGLFAVKNSDVLSDEEAEENIHIVDFDAEIARARQAGNYTRASRLLYLQTLKHLTDSQRIDWQPQKTPTQYTREFCKVADEGATAAFKALTSHFMRIRYGGFEADEHLFELMQSMQQTTEKGGAA